MSVRSAEGLMVLVTFVAAFGWLATKHSLADFTPYTFIAVRFCLAALVLLVFSWRELLKLPARQHGIAFATSVLQGVSMLIWIHAMSTAELIGEGAFIVSLSVVFMPLLGRILFSDHISARLFLALPVAVSGLALLSLDHGFKLRPSQVGFLVSSVGFSLHLLVSARVARSIPALSLATWQLGAGGALAVIVALIYEPFNLSVPLHAWGWLLASAVLASSLRFAMQTKAIGFLSPTQIGMILLLEPVWVVFLGAWQLAERMPTNKIYGCMLIFGALVIYRARMPLRKAAAV